MHDRAADEPGIAERAGRLLDVAGRERRADRPEEMRSPRSRPPTRCPPRNVAARLDGEQVRRAGAVLAKTES